VDPLAASTIAQTQATIQGQVAVSILKKTLDITAEQGAELVRMMSQQAGVGQRVDLSA
jgi:hypothetical protein